MRISQPGRLGMICGEDDKLLAGLPAENIRSGDTLQLNGHGHGASLLQDKQMQPSKRPRLDQVEIAKLRRANAGDTPYFDELR